MDPLELATGHWPLATDKFHDECGVVAIYGHPEAANLSYLGLYALQHRGQESAGIATSDGKEIHCHKNMGHVAAKPWDSPEAAKAIAGKAITADTAEAAAKAAVAGAQPLSQNAYKVSLARVAVKRALLEAAKQKA